MGFSFEYVLLQVKHGRRAFRWGWGDSSHPLHKYLVLVPAHGTELSYLALEYPEGHPKYPHGCRAPWTPTRCDLLEHDWMVY